MVNYNLKVSILILINLYNNYIVDLTYEMFNFKKMNDAMDVSSGNQNTAFQMSKQKPAYIKSSVWNHYIGKEIGEHPCLLCGVSITQSDFQCGYGTPICRGGTTTLENLLPICNKCNSTKGSKTIEEFSRHIGRTRMLFLYEKMKIVMENCILDLEIIKARSTNFNILKFDEQICRIIATNSMLWMQFNHLKEKMQNISRSNGYINTYKIKISIWEKMIILSI